MPDKCYRLGCDIGGTFTDFVLLNDQTGEIKTGKCLGQGPGPLGCRGRRDSGAGSDHAGLCGPTG